ncbi:nitroreductase family protein [Sphaerisporangium fuscum]|uniref:nitroreductase family protein n=1 Tax=Sphaerisporangium fuscum TaxID=2835868 RepID=UPI001BDBC877|nr:nitroreductase family protein [Sphaerisporangium fuscum]
MPSELRAEHIGRAARFDMQLTVPERPVLRLGVRLRPAGDGVSLDGAVRSRLLRGEFARTRLMELADLLDGTRDHAGIAAALDLSEDIVFKVIALLWTSGAVEDHANAVVRDVTPLAVCFSRLGDSTAVHEHWSLALDHLAARTVTLAGDEPLVAEVGRALAATGVQVARHTEEDRTRPALTVVLTDGHLDAALSRLATTCWTSGRALLHVAWSGRRLLIGPYVDPAFTPCLHCARGIPQGDGGSRTGIQLAAGLIARELTSLLSRSLNSALPMDSIEWDLDDLRAAYRPQVTRPGCPYCSQADGPVSDRLSPGGSYEASVAAPPREFLAVKGHQAHYEVGNMELQHRFRDWPGAARTSLPHVDPAGLRAGMTAGDGTGRPPGPHDLAMILLASSGIRSREPVHGKIRRWTAAGGNIGAVTTYVLPGAVEGLPGRAYAYVDLDHELAEVGRGGARRGAGTRVVFTGDVDKVAEKYGAFALRVVFQDAGCALATAVLVAGALGVGFRHVADWDEEELRAELGLAESEVICGVLDLLGGDDGAR